MPAKTYVRYDGKSFYVSTDEPVWPYRLRETPDGAEPTPALINDPAIILALQSLDRLEMSTRPSSADSTEKGKDLAASIALNVAARLFKQVAGWAINHQFGKAKNGLGFRPIIRHPSLADLFEQNAHHHEKVGRISAELDPIEARQFLLNILYAMGSPLRIPKDVTEALEALQYGETLPIFTKVRTTKRSGLTEYRAKLAAIAFIAFENEKGIKRKVSTQIVADEFLVTDASVNDWKVELRTALGAADVNSVLRMAQVCARDGIDEQRRRGDHGLLPYYEEQFGRPALQRAARRYKARSRKISKKTPKARG